MSPVIWYIFPPIGGPGLGRYWRAYYLARIWQTIGIRSILIGPGYHHHFQSADIYEGTHEIGGVTYHFIPARAYGPKATDRVKAVLSFPLGLLQNRALAALASEAPPDIVIYSSPYPFGYVAAHRIARRHGAGLVFEVRDLWPLSLTEILDMSHGHPFVLAAGACERFAYRTADRVVSLLPKAASHMVSKGLHPSKFAYVPNGIDPEEADHGGPAGETPLLARARTAVSEGRFLVVHAGNMSVTTSLMPLLRAAKLLLDQGRRDIAVWLVGRGESEEELKAYAQAEGLTNVEFFPQVGKGELSGLLRTCHAGFAALSPKPIYRFGYSLNKLFDYMLAGLPVVFACDVPGGIVEEAGAGRRTPANDPIAIAAALVSLADDHPSNRAAMGRRGHAYVTSAHNYRTLGRQYAQLFAEIRPQAFRPVSHAAQNLHGWALTE